MAFQFSESHIEEYERNGFTVFRGILPSSLIDDLRRVCDLGATIAREKSGGQSQRFQPVSSLEIDQQPFRDYSELPVLRDAVARVLTPAHAHGDLDLLGVLIEPAADAYCTQWHRDWRDNVPSTDIAEFEKLSGNKLYFGQVNCALYEDSCTWFVPGSHARLDTPEEAALFSQRPFFAPDLEGKSAAEREALCLEYCRRMPHSKRLILDAGDFALYRSSLWHIGNYLPYKRRATLHDGAMTPEFHAFRDRTLARAREGYTAWDNSDRPGAVVANAVTAAT